MDSVLLFCYSDYSGFGHRELFHIVSHVPLICPILFWAFPYYCGKLWANLVCSLHQPWKELFLQRDPISFIGEWYLETKIWALGMRGFVFIYEMLNCFLPLILSVGCGEEKYCSSPVQTNLSNPDTIFFLYIPVDITISKICKALNIA